MDLYQAEIALLPRIVVLPDALGTISHHGRCHGLPVVDNACHELYAVSRSSGLSRSSRPMQSSTTRVQAVFSSGSTIGEGGSRVWGDVGNCDEHYNYLSNNSMPSSDDCDSVALRDRERDGQKQALLNTSNITQPRNQGDQMSRENHFMWFPGREGTARNGNDS